MKKIMKMMKMMMIRKMMMLQLVKLKMMIQMNTMNCNRMEYYVVSLKYRILGLNKKKTKTKKQNNLNKNFFFNFVANKIFKLEIF